jgi:gliding motility-associated-like protein
MKRAVIFLLSSIVSISVSAQFEPHNLFDLSDTAVYTFIQAADFDNNGLVDIFVASNANGKTYCSAFENINGNSLAFHSSFFSTLQHPDFFFTDFDSDNQMDVIVSGNNGSEIWLNQGNFNFNRQLVFDVGGQVVFGDLDNDGSRELVISGATTINTPFVHIYKRVNSVWILANDSIQITSTSLEITDFNKDGKNDLFISGRDANGNPNALIYYQQLNFHFTSTELQPAFNGRSSLADVNQDGFPDIELYGATNQNNNEVGVFINRRDYFSYSAAVPGLKGASVISADFDHDGLPDFNSYGLSTIPDSISIIHYANGLYDTLQVHGVMSESIGDFDSDGDPDIVALTKSATKNQVMLLSNEFQKNDPPGSPAGSIGFHLFNRIFLYWNKPHDDATSPFSITYDVGLTSTQTNLETPGFDQLHFKRLIAEQGNAGPDNFVLIKSNQSIFNFSIQAIDNAYAGSQPASGTNACVTLSSEIKEICKHEAINLSVPEAFVWFSFRSGWLADQPSILYQGSSSDTVFAIAPVSDQCFQVAAFLFHVTNQRNVHSQRTRYVCQDSVITLIAEPGWEQVFWSSTKMGFLSGNDSLKMKVIEDDEIKLHLSDGGGCSVDRDVMLKLSKPVLEVAQPVLEILKGESVELQASGEGSFQWMPERWLSDSKSANVLARPVETTTYGITLTDSVGCIARDSVLILVAETAFVPTLFTPNGDGQNDDLKIYGLGAVHDFMFTIYNREGIQVHSSSSEIEMTTAGWNGMKNGVSQPNGVYYWKVSGKDYAGNSLLLNGKSSGAVVLMR